MRRTTSSSTRSTRRGRPDAAASFSDVSGGLAGSAGGARPSRRQHAAQPRHQLLAAIGLGDHRIVRPVLHGNEIARIARRQQHGDVGPTSLRQRRQFDGRNRPRHHDIGEQQIEARVPFQDGRRHVGILRGNDPVAPAGKHVDHRMPHLVVVFDDQHTFAARRRVTRLGGCFGDRVHGARQIELHAGALADRAVDPDMAVRLADEAIHHAEAEAGALAVAFGGEERIEGLGGDLRRHAGAGIVDGDQDIRPRRDVGMQRGIAPVERRVRDLDRHRAAVRHGVARIDREVENGVLELAGIDLGVPRIVGDAELHGDTLAQRVPQQVGKIGHQPRHVGRLRHRAAGDARTPAAAGSGGRRDPPRLPQPGGAPAWPGWLSPRLSSGRGSPG